MDPIYSVFNRLVGNAAAVNETPEHEGGANASGFATNQPAEPKYKLNVISRKEGNKKALIFTHGFLGQFLPLPENFLKNLAEQPAFKDRNIYLFSYPSSLLRSDPSIPEIAQHLQCEVAKLPEETVGFLGHSQGGLVNRKTVLSLPPKDLKRTDYVGCLGTPNEGSDLTLLIPGRGTIKNLGLLKDQIQDLTPDSPFLKELNSEWRRRFSDPPFMMRVIAGRTDNVVSKSSALSSFSRYQQREISSGHIGLINPKNEELLKILSSDMEALSARESPTGKMVLFAAPYLLNWHKKRQANPSTKGEPAPVLEKLEGMNRTLRARQAFSR